MNGAPAPEPAGYEPTPRTRRWRWLKRIAVSVFVSLAGYYGWLLAEREWTKRQGARELAEVSADVERGDPDWTWDRLNAARKRPPEGKNGAELIPQIKHLSRPDWGKELVKDVWKTRLDVPPNVRFSPLVVAQVRGELNASADAVKLARTLRDYPSGHRDIVLKPNVLDTLLEDTQNTRHAADLLRWDVVLAVEGGDKTRAADDLLAILNASRSIGDEPFLISQLVRMAVRSVAVRHVEWVLAHAPDAPRLAELQAALAADAEEPLLLHGCRGDRAAFDRLFENLQTGEATPGRVLDGGSMGTWEKLGWWHYRARLPADRAYALWWMTRCVDSARLPVHEQPAAFATIPTPPRDPNHLMSGLLLPAVEKVASAHWRTTAETRCAVVSIACERFRQKHNRWPNDLPELAPALLPAVPLDPFDGRPLRFAKSEEGAAVYSVGKRPPSQFGLNPSVPPGLPEGVEIGFRLWNPDQRRLPPLPEPAEPEQQP